MVYVIAAGIFSLKHIPECLQHVFCVCFAILGSLIFFPQLGYAYKRSLLYPKAMGGLLRGLSAPGSLKDAPPLGSLGLHNSQIPKIALALLVVKKLP